MTDYVINEYFLNVGKSIYNFELAYLYDNYHEDHIGHFGLGFWAAFMLSTEIVIRTQSYHDKASSTIKLDKRSNFATIIRNGPPISHGTEIVLHLGDIQQALHQKSEDECIDLLLDYIRNTFLDDGIELYYKKDTKHTQILNLRNVEKCPGDIISQYLTRIEACVNIPHKEFPPIFYAQTPEVIKNLEYDNLLKKLVGYDTKSDEIPYLDTGYFMIFPGNEEIEKDFMLMAKSSNPRRNYSPVTSVSNSISCRIGEFCTKNGLEIPTYCKYGTLTILAEGETVALCERNVVCSRFRTGMMKYDACGEPQRDDSFYLRDVLLPHLHIQLPYMNFRYNFCGLLANIKTCNIFPTLTRDTITDEKAYALSYAIGYAIAKSKIDTKLSVSENKLIREYLYSDIDSNIFIEKGSI